MDKPGQVSSTVTREKLIEAAGPIFAAKGLRGATIREITQSAGANIAAVNYHFRDKFELYTQVLRRAHEGIVTAMSRPLTADTPEGRVRQLLSAMFHAALDPQRPRWQTRLIGRELLQPSPAMDLMDELMRPMAQRLRETIREIRPDLTGQQLTLAVSNVVAPCIFHTYHAHIMHRMFPGEPDPELAVLAEQVVDYALAALRGLHATPARPTSGER